MGSELQAKYQKLAQEYAKLRAQVDVLKNAVRSEQVKRNHVEEELRSKEQSLRKHVQENESLGFRNQQLSKRVSLLQNELESPQLRHRKKKDHGDLHSAKPSVSEVQSEELASKIAQNEQLHIKIYEVTQKSEKVISQLKEKIAKLEQEVADNDKLILELNKEHSEKIDTMDTEKALLQAKVEKLSHDLKLAYGDRLQSPEAKDCEFQGKNPNTIFNDYKNKEFNALNLLTMDRSSHSKLHMATGAAMEMTTNFITQLSSLHSYMKQRCMLYPTDTSTGLQPSPVNQKLYELLQNTSVYTSHLLDSVKSYASASDMGGGSVRDISNAMDVLSHYIESIVAYIELSLQAECIESICGSHLTEINTDLIHRFNVFSGVLSTAKDYVDLLTTVENGSTTQAVLLNKLQCCCVDLQEVLSTLGNCYTTKVTLEYQLPTITQVVEFFNVHGETLRTSVSESTESSTGQVTTVSKLRQQAVNYQDLLQKDSCPQVPYRLAVHLSQSFSDSNENVEAMTQQVATLKDKLSKEKEQLAVDIQLINLKYEKNQKKLFTLESRFSSGGSPSMSFTLAPSIDKQQSLNSDSLEAIDSADVPGSLTEMDPLIQIQADEPSVEALIRDHFSCRIADLNVQLQEAESKAAFFHSQCTTFSKQLNYGNSSKKELSHDLQTARESIQQLQDQLATLSSNYDSQLSTMSDHVCELQEKLLRKEEEAEYQKRGKKKWTK